MQTGQPTDTTTSTRVEGARPRNGLGVAALVIGVAALVGAVSFVLFPAAFVAAIVGIVIAILALAGRRRRGSTNTGQMVAGLVCSIVALAITIDLSVHVGTWAAHNTGAFTRLDRCIARSNNQDQVANCIAAFARDVRS
jgi:hypothetical protein